MTTITDDLVMKHKLLEQQFAFVMDTNLSVHWYSEHFNCLELMDTKNEINFQNEHLMKFFCCSYK